MANWQVLHLNVLVSHSDSHVQERGSGILSNFFVTLGVVTVSLQFESSNQIADNVTTLSLTEVIMFNLNQVETCLHNQLHMMWTS